MANGAPRIELARPQHWVEGLLALTVVVGVMAVGSLHAVTLIPVAGLATVAAVLAVLGRIQVPAARLPLLITAALFAYTLFQLLPLPFAWLSALAPASAAVWDGALAPLGIGAPARASISLDAGASWVEALRLWTYGAVFVSAVITGARRGAHVGALLIAASALLLCIVSIAHKLVDAQQVFGIYTPHDGGRGFRASPLLNPNNLSGYLNMGCLCGAGVAAARNPPLPRWLLAVALVPMIGLSLLTGSRAGVAALLVGAVALTILLLRARPSAGGTPIALRTFFIFTAITVTAGTILAFAAGGGRVAHLLLAQDATKLKAAWAALPMIADFARFGVGRGAFESVFPAYHAAGDNTIYSHPENFLVQWSSEWGLPVALAAMLAAAYAFRPSVWRYGRSSACCGLLSAAFALLAQNFFDLSLEVPGVTIAFTACIGFALGHENGQRGKSQQRWKRRAIVPALATLGFAFVAVGSGRLGRNTLTVDRETVRGVTLAEAPPVESWRAFREAALQAMQRHPAEPYFGRLGAVHAWRTGQANPLPWVRRALERGLSVGRTHYLLATYLAYHGRKSQALMELRLAMDYDARLVPAASALAAKLSDNLDDLLRTAPIGSTGATALTRLANAKRSSAPVLSLSLQRAAVQQDPKSVAPRVALLKQLVDALEGPVDALPCAEPARADCSRELVTLLSATRARFPEGEELPLLQARVDILAGRYSQALALLAATCQRLQQRLPCIRVWATAMAHERDRVALSSAIRALDLEPCPEPEECAEIIWILGDAALQMGDQETALRQYEKAASESASAKRWRRLAAVAARLGANDRAMRALLRASALKPGDRGIATEIDALRLKSLPSRH